VKININQAQWESMGKQAGWLKEESKKKKWKPNPWAVCTKSVGRDSKEKYERCVMDVKKNQK